MIAMFHIFKRKLRYYYISELDKALDARRKQHPRTPSQQSEINKHNKVFQLRDQDPKD